MAMPANIHLCSRGNEILFMTD